MRRLVTDDQYFTNLLVYGAFPNSFATQKSHSYHTVAMINQFAMQKSHIYSIADVSTLKA